MNTKELELILEGKSKKSTAGQIFTIAKCLTQFAWIGTKFVAKNTPTVLGVAWQIKKNFKRNSTRHSWNKTRTKTISFRWEN